LVGASGTFRTLEAGGVGAHAEPPELVAATPEPTTPAWKLRESEGNPRTRRQRRRTA
jgi:hypothetical protein